MIETIRNRRSIMFIPRLPWNLDLSGSRHYIISGPRTGPVKRRPRRRGSTQVLRGVTCDLLPASGLSIYLLCHFLLYGYAPSSLSLYSFKPHFRFVMNLIGICSYAYFVLKGNTILLFMLMCLADISI